MMKEKRVSNKLKQKQLETKYLEEQTKKMEDKLTELKKQIEQQKKLKAQMGLDSTITRWQKTVKTSAPLKSYAKQILQEQKQVHKQFGINPKKITGTKTFEGVLKQIKVEKQEEQERNPTKIATFLKQEEEEDQQIVQIPQKTVLENNFFKAKMDVKKLIKQKTLEEFLQENYILEYLSTFRQQGITDLQGLRYITRDQLTQMQVKAGHQVKIIKKIKEEFDKQLQGKYEEPEVIKTTGVKIQSGYGEGDVNTYSQIEKPNQKIEVKDIDQSRHESAEEDEDQDEEEYQDQVLVTVPTESISLQAQSARHNCYECYRVIFSVQFQYEQKCFCSSDCMQRFLSQLRKRCPTCNTTFIKTGGYREDGVWFCSLGCCPNHEEIEDLFFQWHQERS